MLSKPLNIKISLGFLINLSVAAGVFIFCMLIDPYYSGGDPSLYKKVYEELSDLNLINGYIFYSDTLDSKEFVHFFLSWLFSHIGIERSFFNAVSSAVLAYVALLVFHERKASIFISVLTVLTNLYFILLYTTTERLKIGMIFFCFSLININKPKKFYIYAFFASISHIQILIVYLSMFFYKLYIEIPKLIFKGKLSKNLILILILILIPLIVSYEQISSKFNSYYAVRDFSNLARILLFFSLSLWYSNTKIETFIIFLPLIFAIFFLGGDRLNMFGYFVFLYYSLPVRKGLNFGVLLSLIYFLFSSFGFITGIIQEGIPVNFNLLASNSL